MNAKPSRLIVIHLFRALAIIALLTLAACGNFPIATPTPEVSQPTQASQPEQPGTPQAEVIFDVQVPQGTSPDAKIFLNILDEVTGLALNTAQYPLSLAENGHFTTRLAVSVGSVVKYRYTRDGNPGAVEYNTLNQQTRYRLLRVDSPVMTQDIVSAWGDQLYQGPTGRISGTATDTQTGRAIPNLLVTAGGSQTLTASDGTYLLEGLPPGTHNLVLYALDGAYHTFQQGASVASDSTTPAPVALTPAPLVNVTFVAAVPSENVVGVPVRLAGSLYQTGNTFADLAGGMSSIASRMPLMQMGADGKYSLTLALPAGADLHYKYTLGDGFWNAEQTSAGTFRVRHLVVPSQDTTINDTVETWRAGSSAPITFQVTVPADTPVEDFVSIQFNPYGWTEPIPMWSLGENRWMYVLYGPLNLLGQIGYRYCRSDQCGSADDAATPGENTQGFPFTSSQLPQTFEDEVTAWNWWTAITTPTTVMAADIVDRGSSFLAGVEFQPGYHPSWQTRYPPVLQNLKSVGTGWTVFTPTWTYTRSLPPVIEQVPGTDALWFDLLPVIGQANGQQMTSAIFPHPRFPEGAEVWWQAGTRDAAWWNSWFESYQRFILHHADLATQSGAQALILGGDWLAPALPGGALVDGTSSGVPLEAEARWRSLIEQARSRFSGQVFWALPYPEGIENQPVFLDAVDAVYLLLDAPLANTPNPSEADLEAAFAAVLDNEIAPFQANLGKPITLAVAYPSADGGASGCIQADSGCLDPALLARPLPDQAVAAVDLQEQVDVYNGLFAVVNARKWISGIVSRGFYLPAALQDKSASVHGKPAYDVLWYWFPRLTGQPVE